MDVSAVESFVRAQLSTRLSPDLYYHNIGHTLDVVKASMRIADEEGVEDEHDRLLLLTAAWMHDTGFMVIYDNHEEEGCRMSRELLPQHGYSPTEIDTVCSLIMKTKVPQMPVTHLECILCDADLDHLGSDDFKTVSDRLHKEWVAFKRLNGNTEWDQVQFDFLSRHRYWTRSSQQKRDLQKERHMEAL
ncbi:MAG: HD domain-containing protein, partial [Bacteroidia bacterium]|nr:HD domain-containing protein [Bacteroidia bacterium]